MTERPHQSGLDPAERPTRRLPQHTVVDTPIPQAVNLPSLEDEPRYDPAPTPRAPVAAPVSPEGSVDRGPPPPSSRPASAEADKAIVFAALEERGWRWRDGALYAPHETLWLEGAAPWNGHLRAFRERVAARASRIMMTDVSKSTARKLELEGSLKDSLSLVAVLDSLLVTLALRDAALRREARAESERTLPTSADDAADADSATAR